MARTARQRAALRKAQLASARKRKGKGKSRVRKYAKRAAIGYGVAAMVTTGAVYGLGRQLNSKQSKRKNFADSVVVGAKLPAILTGLGARSAYRKAKGKKR